MKRGKREAKRTGLGRRLLSVFLAVVMCTSMLQLSVFAADLDPAVKQAQDAAQRDFAGELEAVLAQFKAKENENA